MEWQPFPPTRLAEMSRLSAAALRFLEDAPASLTAANARVVAAAIQRELADFGESEEGAPPDLFIAALAALYGDCFVAACGFAWRLASAEDGGYPCVVSTTGHSGRVIPASMIRKGLEGGLPKPLDLFDDIVRTEARGIGCDQSGAPGDRCRETEPNRR